MYTPSRWWKRFQKINVELAPWPDFAKESRCREFLVTYEPGSKLVVLGMAIAPLIGNPYNGYINPYYWVDDHPLLYGNNGSLDPSTYAMSCTKPLFVRVRGSSDP